MTAPLFFRRLSTVALASLLMALACSCVSSRRAMKISPFSEPQAVGEMEAERINLWPLAYHAAGGTSILWPLVDWDDQGFAMRPLYNREGDDQSILFPFSAWNARRGHGWAGTAYWDDGVYGMFPLLHVGRSSRWLAPVYWSDKTYGVVPLLHVGERSGHVLPVWWRRRQDELDAWGVFPLWSQRHLRDAEKSDWRLGMGLLGRSYREGDDERSLWLAPAYFNRRSGDERFQTLFPLYFAKRDADSLLRLALPVYMQRHRNDEKLVAMPPLFMYSADSRASMLVTPLGGRGWTRDGDTVMRNIAGPVYHWRQSADETFTALAWPLYQQRSGFRTFKAASWPLLTTLERERGETRKLLVLGGAWYQGEENRCALWGLWRSLERDGRTSWRAWPLVSSLRHKASTIKDPLFDLSLVNSYRFENEHGFMLTPLFGYRATGRQRETRAWPLYSQRERFDPAVKRRHLLTLAYRESREGERRTGVWPLFAHVVSDRTTHPRPLERLSAISLCQGRSNWDYALGFGLLGSSSGYADGETSRVEHSALLIAKTQAWKRDPRATIDAWSRSFGYSSAGNVKTNGWHLFPLAFREEREFLQLFPDDQSLLAACRDWMSLDARRNAEPEKLLAAEAKLSDLLANQPTASRLLEEAETLSGKERSAKIREALADFAWQHASQSRRARFRVPLIFRSRTNDDDFSWSFLFGLANYHRVGDESRLSVLRHLYRREKTADRIYRDMIPFLTWNSREDGGDFSFAWRLLAVDRSGDALGGHIVFIPWGSKSD